MTVVPKFAESQTLPDVDYAAFAASIGSNATVVKDPEELSDAWRDALSPDRPTVLDVFTDPDMPAIPPHAEWDQAKAAAMAVLKGDENRWGFIVEGIKTKAEEFMPHKNG